MMFILHFLGVSAIIIVVVSRTYGKDVCKPGKPVGYAWDNAASLGIWYQYMYGPPSHHLENLTNPVEVYRGIGWIQDSGETVYSTAVFVTARQSVPPYSCWASYATQNTSCNGFTYAKGYFGGLGTGEMSVPGTFYKLYLDANFVYIRSFCFDKDTLTADPCNQPGIAVWTRKRPIDVTPLEDRIIRDILDDRLQFYCLGAADMLYNPYTDSLGPCDYVEKPQGFMGDIRYAQEHLVSKCGRSTSSCSGEPMY